MREETKALVSIWKMENSNMLLTPEIERKSESPDASPPMGTGRRRGSNSRLPSLATLVRIQFNRIFLEVCYQCKGH